MALEITEFVSLLITALAAGMFCCPWLALTRSINALAPDVLIAVVRQLSRNMAPVMTILIPATLLSMIAVAVVSFGDHPGVCWLALGAVACFVVTLIVTVLIEVPIVQQIETWTVTTLPENWQQLRDRWRAFHVIRVGASLAGLALLLAAAIF
jgi:uncharacterized membrane protein